MPRFSDYHRTVVGYHGTQRSVAEKIVLRTESLQAYHRPHDWMGGGVYYWEYGPKEAWRFAEVRRRQRGWAEPVAVVASMIRLGFCFDLLDPDNAKDLKSFHDDFLESQQALGLTPPANKRRWKYLDNAVFEYAYAAIEAENEKSGTPVRVDTCRGVHVRSGRLWKESWVQHGANIQILVRNPECILGSWLVEPEEDRDHGDAETTDGPIGDDDLDSPGGQGFARDD